MFIADMQFVTVEEVLALRKAALNLEAKVDELMMAYCPEEVTDEQFMTWLKHQRQL